MAAVLHLPEPFERADERPESLMALAELFSPYVVGESAEWVLVAGFDGRGLLCSFFGAADHADSNRHMMACVRAALRMPQVSAIALAHNHPYGPARPSAQDIAATRQIASLSRLCGASLIDHFIFAPDAVVSFRSTGLIS